MATKFSFSILFAILLVQFSAWSQDTDEIIDHINHQLKNSETTISAVLMSDSLMHLHSLTPFREVIKANAKAEKVTMVTPTEPGTRITVEGQIVNKEGIAQKDILLYFYQTSDWGWYADTAIHIQGPDGDMKHAKLFCYLKTNDNGEFSFETIKPRGYPKSSITGHVHVSCWTAEGKYLQSPQELQFEDDFRMSPLRKKETLEEGNLIAGNSGTSQKPVYSYRIIVE